MATPVLINNFTSGIVSKMARRMVGTQIYNNSASTMENVVPLITGGFKIRQGLRFVKQLHDKFCRIIPFVISEDEYYIIALEPLSLCVFKFSDYLTIDQQSFKQFDTPYQSVKEINEIQYAQDFERVILAHKNYIPKVIERKLISTPDSAVIGINYIDFELKKTTNKYYYDVNKNKTYIDYQYQGLFTTKGNYPSCVTFCSNRLYFACSDNNKQRFWASRPFEYNNFQFEEYYETIDSQATAKEYFDSITGQTASTEYYTDENCTNRVGSETEANYKLVVSKSSDKTSGYTIITRSKYKKKVDPARPESIVWEFIETTQETKQINAAQTKWKTVITPDCAFMEDVGSDRNDTICWIATKENIYIGTTSTEYCIQSNADAQNHPIKNVSSYGSAKISQPVSGNSNIFYIQTGKKILRSLSYNYYDGTVNKEITTLCRELFDSKIKHIYWQRVPNQRLYCLMENGEVNVLLNDGGNISAWTKFLVSDEINIISLSVIDTERGQDVYALLSNGSICVFEDDWFMDQYSDTIESAIRCRVVTNYIDSSDIIASTKRSQKAFIDSIGTRYQVGQKGVELSNPRTYDSELTMISISSRATENVSYEIRNLDEKEDFVVLALIIELEVS